MAQAPERAGRSRKTDEAAGAEKSGRMAYRQEWERNLKIIWKL